MVFLRIFDYCFVLFYVHGLFSMAYSVFILIVCDFLMILWYYFICKPSHTK